MNVNLRLSTENDLSLIEHYVRAYHDFEGVTHHGEEISKAIRPLLGQSTLGRIWLICIGEEPVGYIAICFGYTIEFSGRDAFVDEMFIAKEHRGKGVGKAVFLLVKAQLAQVGIKVLHLEVARTNERAQRLYRSAGFVPRERFYLMSALITARQGAEPDSPATAAQRRDVG